MTLTRISVLVCLVAALVMIPTAVAQQQTGELVGIVSDPTGAVIPGAKVTVSSPALLAAREVETDSQGVYRLAALPPGMYKLAVTVSGFRTYVQERIDVRVGRTTAADVTMEVGAVAETVTVEAGAALIDPVKSESAGVWKGDDLVNAAGGRDYTDFASYMPSVNLESNYAFGVRPTNTSVTHKGRATVQVYVDGSSGAENVFFVDGIDSTNMYTGLANQNLRTETVQEFQVKTAGYEAEFGGAMGGVMSVVTRGGSNDFHGSVLWYYYGSAFEAKPRQRLRLNPDNDDIAEYFQDPEDSISTNEFGVALGGPIVRDKAWFYGTFIPQLTNTKREAILSDGTLGLFRRDETLRAGTAKLDFQPIERVKLGASYMTDHYRWKGGLPSHDRDGNPDFDWGRQGFEYPSYTVAGNATVTATPRFIIDARWGLNALGKNQFLGPTEVRNFFIESNGEVGFDTADPLYRPVNWATYPYDDGYATTQDFQKKSTYKSDAAYLLTAGGQHSLKFGYMFNRLSHAVNDAYKFDYIRHYYGRTWTMIDGTVRSSTCTGPDGNVYTPCGYYEVRAPFGVLANIHTDRHALYFQDAWTINNRFTVNAGVRFEKESIPSFSDDPQFAGSAFSWGFGDKWAPRLGASFDVFGNRKLKIFGSWGWFFDAMKLEMANGSFGGFKWISNYYLYDSANILTWLTTGGSPGAGPYPGTYLEARDWRPVNFDDLDPDLNPMRMSEAVAGFEWEVAPDYVLSFRYTHKQLDEAIEDVGRQTPVGEAYYITNPGRGYAVSKFTEIGLPATPDPDRTYNAWEFRLVKAFSNHWRADMSYVYSRLRGLYSGLGSSDESGRLSPNVDRDFDLWFLSYDSHGNLLHGPLGTDRPHQVKLNASYEFPFGLEIGGFQRIMSGVPISRWTSLEHVEIYVENRGSDGRNPTWAQTDLQAIQRFHPFADEAKTLEFSFNVINVFNQKTALRSWRTIYRDNLPLWTPDQYCNVAGTVCDPSPVLNGYDVDAIAAALPADPDPRFLDRDLFLPPIEARFGVKFIW